MEQPDQRKRGEAEAGGRGGKGIGGKRERKMKREVAKKRVGGPDTTHFACE